VQAGELEGRKENIEESEFISEEVVAIYLRLCGYGGFA
jgi:hypothetical protein